MQKDNNTSVRKEDVSSSNTDNSINHHVGERKAKFEILPPPRPNSGYVEFIEGGSRPNDVSRTSSENKKNGEAKDGPPDDNMNYNESRFAAIKPGALSDPGIRGNQRDATLSPSNRSASEDTSEERRFEFPPLVATVVTEPIAVTAEPIMPQTQHEHIPDEENALNNAPPTAISKKRKFKIAFGLMFLLIAGVAIGLGVSLSQKRDDETNQIGKLPNIFTPNPSQPPSSSRPTQPSNISASSPLTLHTHAPTFIPYYQPSNKPSNEPSSSPSILPTHKPTPIPTNKPTIKTCPCKQVTIIAIQTDTEGWGEVEEGEEGEEGEEVEEGEEGEEVEVKLYIDNAVVWPNSGFGDLPHGTFGENQWLPIDYAKNIEKSTGNLFLKVEDHDDLGSNNFDSVIVPESNWHEKRCDTYEKEYMTDVRNWMFRIQVKAC